MYKFISDFAHFLKIGFGSKKYNVCGFLVWTVTAAILHQKLEKVIKKTQNVPKTVDNQEQLVLV